MELHEIIQKRRAYRSFEPVKITEEFIHDLAEHAMLSPSCNNMQPWRFIFINDPEELKELKATMSKNNDWTGLCSMMIAVFTKPDLDCVIKDRVYCLFDTGMATAFLILRAWDLGLVAHPIAGFDPAKVKAILKIPDEMTLITLVIVGKKKDAVDPILTPKQAAQEKDRPERFPFEMFAYINKYTGNPTPKT
jgi:nitroreductase